MKKLFFTAICGISLTGCAELGQFNPLNQVAYQMPPYEFYETFSETGNLSAVSKFYNPISTSEGKHFRFPSYLVNADVYHYYDANLYQGDYYYTPYTYLDTKNNVVKKVKIEFPSVLKFNRTNFYKIFNLKKEDMTIKQLKLSCTEYRRGIAFYELLLKNKKKLYLTENGESYSASSSMDISIYRKPPSCDTFGYKTEKSYGNSEFEK